jgi:triosephosphate isomerase
MAVPGRRGSFIAGNWKMYKPLGEARQLAEEVVRGLSSRLESPEDDSQEDDGRQGQPASQVSPRVGLFPNAIALQAVAEIARGRNILVGAQNIHFEKEGAFTGEISAEMVLSAGARSVILGHSERRHVFGESDEIIGKKVVRALEAGLIPILCVGEKLEERETGKTQAVVLRQLSHALEGVSDAGKLARIIFAYEPVWAIGTGRTATPAQGQEVHRFLRERLAAVFRTLGAPAERAQEVLILYGGSVKPENAVELLAEADIDGLLVGGGSLNAGTFLKICKAAA